MNRLALLRHGHTDWNRAGRIQGRTDIPLDATAANDLSRLMLPAPWDKARLVSSPLERASHTAQLVSDRQPETEGALMEMNWGDWEGKHGIDLRANADSGYLDIEDWGWNYTPPNGESPAALRHRLLPWVSSLTGDTIAVCHIGVMRVLLALATGWDFDGPAPFQIKRNRLYVIDIEDAQWTLHPDPVRLVERPS
jgi:probable phosphoglycerate mutase